MHGKEWRAIPSRPGSIVGLEQYTLNLNVFLRIEVHLSIAMALQAVSNGVANKRQTTTEIHYGLVKMYLCLIRKTRSVIVPWTHLQPCP